MLLPLLLLLLPCLSSALFSTPIENGVLGEPRVECGRDHIGVRFHTEAPFEGRVFVKGLVGDDRCTSQERGDTQTGIDVPVDYCNTVRTRSLNPRGINVATTVMVSFHPLFLTKVDRAFRISCFYREDEERVASRMHIEDMTTQLVTQVVDLPTCQYQILSENAQGGEVEYGTVGEKVYHSWSCSSPSNDVYCMVVHSCTVDDGYGDKVEVIDEFGCATDRYLIDNLEYTSDLQAGQEAYVYKYADRSSLFYSCQIGLTLKPIDSDCPLPECDMPGQFTARNVSGVVPSPPEYEYDTSESPSSSRKEVQVVASDTDREMPRPPPTDATTSTTSERPTEATTAEVTTTEVTTEAPVQATTAATEETTEAEKETQTATATMATTLAAPNATTSPVEHDTDSDVFGSGQEEEEEEDDPLFDPTVYRAPARIMGTRKRREAEWMKRLQGTVDVRAELAALDPSPVMDALSTLTTPLSSLVCLSPLSLSLIVGLLSTALLTGVALAACLIRTKGSSSKVNFH